MGCGLSTTELDSQHIKLSHEDFKLNYRQFIINTRGEIANFYHFSDILHRSSIAIIRKVIHKKNKTIRACKIIPVQNLKQLKCINEVQILKNLEHPNVSKIYEYFIEKSHIYIIFELINGTSLREKLNNMKQLPFSTIIEIMKQILLVVSMLHQQNIAHRTINPNHIMLQQIKTQYFVRVIDFSQSSYCPSPQLKSPRGYRYQKVYNSEESEQFPFQHDIYCCGLIFLSLLGGSSQLSKIRGNEESIISSLNIPHHEIKFIKSLLLSMLNPSPLQRANIKQVLSHKIFSFQTTPQKSILTNLQKFKTGGSLQTTLLMFATIKFLDFSNRMDLLHEFYSLDTNKDGKIQFSQLKQGLIRAFNLEILNAQQKCQKIFHMLDHNKSGQLQFYQFVLGTWNIIEYLKQQQLFKIFEQLDINNDGMITNDQMYLAIEGKKQISLNFKNFCKIIKDFQFIQKQKNF